MGKETTRGPPALNLKASTNMISVMVSERSSMQISPSMRASGLMISEREWVNLCGLMVQSTSALS